MPVVMKGGGPFAWAPGEWTDDTQMALVIADAGLAGADLREPAALDRIVAGWVGWMGAAADVGAQTRTVLGKVKRHERVSAAEALAVSEALHARTGHTAGNGSLMRTAPVALAFLHEPAALSQAASMISRLTHFDPEAGEACVLWCHLIRHAVLTGELDAAAALAELPAYRALVWQTRLAAASRMRPADFTANGWVVEALQAAWCAITTTGDPRDADPAHVRRALVAAVRGGRDTDTVAAIAGALLGALYGASAVPSRWRQMLRGWPGLRARDLINRAVLLANRGADDASGWPSAPEVDYSGYTGTDAFAVHPHDEGVLLGGVDALRNLPEYVDAVVSLCRLGSAQVPAAHVAEMDHVEVWLVDSADPSANPHLRFVLDDTVEAIADLREEGKTVLLHCVQAQSHTPTVAALYGASLGIPLTEAVWDVRAALPNSHPNARFAEELRSRRG
jgi:ADP-ribosylglycohydrolase